ncbi:LlsX family protein [Hathewaya histolytica]|uniref:LlsX family protein n=1 Tax=Hathewaya histolytica TaxID=1498 RepID=UPI003B678CF3
MNYKRLILSVILGVILGSVLFTILITINMKSLDYSKINESKSFEVLGVKYLSVEKNGNNVKKIVNSVPIATTSIVIGGLSYLGLSVHSKKKNGGV